MTHRPPLTRRALLCALAAGWLAPAFAREAASPRAVTPRGALPAPEQQVVDLFETAAPSVAYITS